MYNRKIKYSIAFILLFIYISAFAEEQTDQKSTESPWKGTNIMLGSSMQTGNTNTKDLDAQININHKKNRWNKIAKFEANLSETEYELSEKNFYVLGQTRYYFTDRNYLYTSANSTFDYFSPYVYQAIAAVGYGRDIIKTDKINWTAAAGPGYMKDKEREKGNINDRTVLDLQSTFSWNITKNNIFLEELDMDISKDNVRTRSTTSLRSNINAHFAMQISLKLEHNTVIPNYSGNSKKLDTTTEIALIYNF